MSREARRNKELILVRHKYLNRRNIKLTNIINRVFINRTMISDNILKQIKAGATVRVFEIIKEDDKERLQKFEGLVLARKHGSESGASFMVRTTISGVGVEKVFPIHSPKIAKVEVVNSPRKVKRSKLYYIRELSRKAARQKLSAAATEVVLEEKEEAKTEAS